MFYKELVQQHINEDFHNYATNIINSFSDDFLKDITNKSLTALTLLPLQEDVNVDYSDLNNLINLEAAIYAIKLNQCTAIRYMSDLALKDVFDVSFDDVDKVELSNKFDLYKHVFNPGGLFSKNLLLEIKDIGDTFQADYIPFFPKSKSALDALDKFRKRNNKKNSSLLQNSLTYLEKSAVDMELRSFCSPNIKKGYPNVLEISKEKTAERYSRKVARSLANSRVDKKLKSYELSDLIKVEDNFGFSFIPFEAITLDNRDSFNQSYVHKLEEFFVNSPNIKTFYEESEDNHYFSTARPMSGVQMYVSVDTNNPNLGINFPFSNLVAAPSRRKISLHLQCAKAYLEGQVGGKGIRPHPIYELSQERIEQENFKALPNKFKQHFLGNVLLIGQVSNLSHLVAAYHSDL